MVLFIDPLLVILLIMAGCAVGNFFIAKAKGRDPVSWALIGLFFGLVGLIILAILPEKVDWKKQQKQREDGALRALAKNMVHRQWRPPGPEARRVDRAVPRRAYGLRRPIRPR